jgi:hypothetical protein
LGSGLRKGKKFVLPPRIYITNPLISRETLARLGGVLGDKTQNRGQFLTVTGRGGPVTVRLRNVRNVTVLIGSTATRSDGLPLRKDQDLSGTYRHPYVAGGGVVNGLHDPRDAPPLQPSRNALPGAPIATPGADLSFRG